MTGVLAKKDQYYKKIYISHFVTLYVNRWVYRLNDAFKYKFLKRKHNSYE